MDHIENSAPRMVDGRPLRFIRLDSDGREISPSELAAMSFTNDTINRVVSQASARISGETGADGVFTQGISSL